MCESFVTSVSVTLYFRKLLWWIANTSHKQVNRIQLNTTDLTANCQRNSCWLTLTSLWCLGIASSSSLWNRGWTAGCLSLPMHCAYLLQWSVYIVHAGDVRADAPLCSLEDPLQWIPLTQGDITASCCDSAAKDVICEFCRPGSWMRGWRLGPLDVERLQR